MKILETPDLLELQKLPYERFLQNDISPYKRKIAGLEELFQKIFPIESDNGKHRIEYVHYMLEEPVDSIDECIEKKSSYESRIRVKLRIISSEPDMQTKELKVKDINEQEIYLGSLPLMTENGSFIINGIERVVVNQLLRCPGVYFKEEPSIGQNVLYSAKIYPSRGLWIEFEIDNHNCLIVWLGKKKVYATVLLKALNCNDDEIKSLFYGKPENMPSGSIIAETLARDDTRSSEEALKRIYKEMRPGYDKVNIKEAAKFLNLLLFSDEVYDLSEPGRRQVNKVLNLDFKERYLRKEDIIETIRGLLNLIEKKEGVVQDIDHLGNKRVRTSAEIVKEHVYEGLVKLKRYAREKMVLLDKDESKKVTLQLLINGKILMTAINDFFARNQLSQFLEKTNPLTEITHKRRITAVGEGGVKERKRASFEVRDVHYTHFGKVCPIETPEGANIGLINSLTVHSKVDELGFIKTPYYRVEKGKVTEQLEYLTADREDEFTIAPPG
ncbi:MAG TPA: DNA-directed RNA polymerase subunit beta, partial [bacterium]|nr:DNA-directed RNA polymerase subunit beta [bacterium]